MKIVNNANSDIPVLEMKDGEIGIIKHWNNSYSDSHSEHIGTIVQRYGSNLIALGKPCGNSWSGFFGNIHSEGKVQILPTGTQIEI